MPKNQLVEQLQRCLKKKISADKYIKKLRNQKGLDTLITIGEAEMTLLMYYVKENQLTKVKNLLTGENPASPLIKNQNGLNALGLALPAASQNEFYDLAITNEETSLNQLTS